MERIRKIPDDSDRVSPDEDDEDMSPYEPTYRDGSAKNECWRDDDGDDPPKGEDPHADH